MGVVYKLKPEVSNFILAQKQANPSLSCRAMVALVEKKFHTPVSKSSINKLFKEANLSASVGRRRKKRKSGGQAAGLGLVLLKAADAYLGGTQAIAAVIQQQLKTPDPLLLAKTEYLLYHSLIPKADSALELLLDHSFSPQEISAYLEGLKEIPALPAEISLALVGIAQDVRSLKINLSDGKTAYLDGQMHTVWSSQKIPTDFSLPINQIRAQLKGDSSLAIFMAPGYDAPTAEFFNFISQPPASVALCDTKFAEIETLPLANRGIAFGLWPWQFGQCRNVKSLGEFKPFYFEPLKKDFYLAAAEVELAQPQLNKALNLKGCALKTQLSENPKLFILANSLLKNVQSEPLAELYLSHWPNLEETFQDFSRKIEAKAPPFSVEIPTAKEIEALLAQYAKALDKYVRYYLLPAKYQNQDSLTGQFYAQNSRLHRQKDRLLLTFLLPPDYPLRKDLEYALRRVNERPVSFENRRLWLAI